MILALALKKLSSSQKYLHLFNKAYRSFSFLRRNLKLGLHSQIIILCRIISKYTNYLISNRF